MVIDSLLQQTRQSILYAVHFCLQCSLNVIIQVRCLVCVCVCLVCFVCCICLYVSVYLCVYLCVCVYVFPVCVREVRACGVGGESTSVITRVHASVVCARILFVPW